MMASTQSAVLWWMATNHLPYDGHR